ncbi:MAG: hypothetical protein SR1Q5_00820 [Quinella sp. 1Q5]|nr:hypothetical protein [Quinella sp. 1Q5]
MVGQIKLEQFKRLEAMPQDYQSAWDSVEWDKLTGAKYKAVLCAGEQLVHGMKRFYIAEQTLSDANATRHLVRIAILEVDGEYLLSTKDFMVIL